MTRTVCNGSIATVLPDLYWVPVYPSEPTRRRQADFAAEGHLRTNRQLANDDASSNSPSATPHTQAIRQSAFRGRRTKLRVRSGAQAWHQSATRGQARR